jgi:hypothetical protein
MKTIEIKLYKFAELSEEAKQKAIEKHYDINVSYDWWDFTYEDAANIGLKITGFDLDRNRHATGKFTLSAAEVAANIIRDHGAECETYKTAEKFLSIQEPLMEDVEENEDALIDCEDDFLKELLEDYSMILQKESEYLQSKEAIIETFNANDYYFTIDGKMY